MIKVGRKKEKKKGRKKERKKENDNKEKNRLEGIAFSDFRNI